MKSNLSRLELFRGAHGVPLANPSRARVVWDVWDADVGDGRQLLG